MSRYFSDNHPLKGSLSASLWHISLLTGHFCYDYHAGERTHTRTRGIGEITVSQSLPDTTAVE